MEETPRLLDAHELRVIGCLLEKQQATPEYYPLTLNALVAACNQRSNRAPVMKLSQQEVEAALSRLEADGLVKEDDRGRAARWSHKVDFRWNLNDPRKAALTVLLLRGPQTSGEVRSRSGRMHEFGSLDEADGALADLAAPPTPIVELLEREPGQKEPRWAHRLGTEQPVAATPSSLASARAASSPAPAGAPASLPPGFKPELVLARLERLEQQVRELEAAVLRKGGL